MSSTLRDIYTTTKTMRQNVKVTVYGLTPSCESTCSFQTECANHASAGDYRHEDGLTPDLKLEGEQWTCSKQPVDCGHGAILTNGKLQDGELVDHVFISSIYTVTTLGHELGQKRSENPNRHRCVGWFAHWEQVLDVVEHNLGDIYEDGYYSYTVIEQLDPGIYPTSKAKWLFKWDRDAARYVQVTKKQNFPRWFRDSQNFGIG